MSERPGAALAAGIPVRHAGSPAWRRLRGNPPALAGGVVLAALYLLALGAPFVAPYTQEEMDRDRFYHPPMRLHFHDATGRRTWWPQVWSTRLADAQTFQYTESASGSRPLRLFARATRYRWLGLLSWDRHLFGVDPPGRLHLLGTDPAGRDVLSRLLYGAQISLTVGLVGIAISFFLGLLLGGISG
ncbi:MAG: hypothetical protein ACHQ52_03580, partial [Candidatus Eisenbacteria bacterium]